MTDDYLIWSHERGAWWGPNKCGYTPSLAQAGRYTRGEALRVCRGGIPGTSAALGALPELPVRLADLGEIIAVHEADHGKREEPWR